jgi:hypothetical protein
MICQDYLAVRQSGSGPNQRFSELKLELNMFFEELDPELGSI